MRSSKIEQGQPKDFSEGQDIFIKDVMQTQKEVKLRDFIFLRAAKCPRAQSVHPYPCA